MGSLRHVILLVLVFTASSGFAQSLTIQLLDSRSKTPIAKQTAKVSFLFEKNGKPSGSDSFNLQTDANGESHLALPIPAPSYLFAKVDLPDARWKCACLIMVKTSDVMEKGTVEHLPEEGKEIAPEPGKIILTARRLSLFERLVYQLMKD